MNFPVIKGWEHLPLEFSENSGLRDLFRAAAGSFQNEKMLGLHFAGNEIRPGNFIGMVWIGEKGEEKTRAVLRADSKFAEMDYIKMFAECAANSQIGARVVRCLHFWAGEDLIETERDSDFLILTALAFLRELHELCRRRLRRNFLRVRQNFCGKVKGKILIAENLRQNIVRARADRIVCEFETVGDDILENRILRAALERAARLLSRYEGKNELAESRIWIRASRAALSGAPVSAIRPHDFISARKRGAFAHYRRPLDLAKAVLRQLGFNPQTEIPEKTKTPPFALNSEKLFEFYAELKLSAKFAGLRAQKQISGGDFNVSVRPDFYIPSEQTPKIIDAKYKKTKNSDEEWIPADSDMYQIVAYSQHRGVREKIGGGGDNAELSLVYPDVADLRAGEIKEHKKTDAFMHKVRVIKIGCPIKKPRN